MPRPGIAPRLALAFPGLGLAVILAVVRAAAAEPLFGDARFYPVGTSPVALASGEFDGAPGADLATVNEDNSVSVLVNNGRGVFGRGSAVGIDDRYVPTGMVGGAFNDEPLTDLAFSVVDTTEFGGAALVYQSRQPFRFTPRLVPMGQFPTCIEAADLDNDGLADFAACNVNPDGSGVVTLARTTAAFGLARGPDVPLGIVVPGRLRAAAIDGDGPARRDLLVTSGPANSVLILYGRGNLTFDPPALLAEVAEPSAAAVDRFDGDGLADIAVTSRRDGAVLVFLQTASRTFALPARYRVGALPAAVAAGDLTGDGITDLAVANNVSNDVSILRGLGDGTFRLLETVRVGAGPVALALADLNGDGKLDLATANQDDRTFGTDIQSVAVALNGETPPFTPTPVPTATRTPRRSPTPTPAATATRTPTPAGPGDNNCDGVRDERDVQVVVMRIFDGVSGCLTRAVTAADVPWTITRLRS